MKKRCNPSERSVTKTNTTNFPSWEVPKERTFTWEKGGNLVSDMSFRKKDEWWCFLGTVAKTPSREKDNSSVTNWFFQEGKGDFLAGTPLSYEEKEDQTFLKPPRPRGKG